jgi:hypothetical protein
MLSSAAPAPSVYAAENATHAQLQSIRKYIKESWRTLMRSNARLADAAVDPKFHATGGGRWPVYLSRKENLKQVEGTLRSQMPQESFAKIELRQLPDDPKEIKEQGLLYLPYPYVVPGGRFNEMYGWDSYFIQVGLLRDGEIELAKNMADNFLYQIENYGKVLNANRTYYLTRSQPPFLTQIKLYGAYPLPWWKLQVSATFQSTPGPEILAAYTARNSEVVPSLIRNLAAGPNGTAPVQLIPNGTVYGDRLTQVDFRLSKTFNLGRARFQPAFDLYNLFNDNPVIAQNNTFGRAWQRPTVIQLGRLAKFGVQVNF